MCQKSQLRTRAKKRMHRGYMPNYYRNNSMYSRPLVRRLKGRTPHL